MSNNESNYVEKKASVFNTAPQVARPYFNNIRNTYIYYLLESLAGVKAFMEKLENLQKRYSSVSGESWHMISEIAETGDAISFEGLDPKLVKDYHNKVVTLITDYGLNPQWACELIHKNISYRAENECQAFPIRIVMEEEPTDETPFKFSIYREADWLVSKQEAKKDVLGKFNQQWKTFTLELKDLGLARDRKRGERSALKDNIRWVFKRVCQRKSWDRIATEEESDKNTVKKVVRPIVRLLGLTEPKLYPGRPKKK